jgi:hypothetical protein
MLPDQPIQPPMPAAPQMMPNPAYAQWQKMQQAAQAIQAANQAAQKKFDDAVALIKKDGVHGFRIDIEADSTIAPDEEAEQAQGVLRTRGDEPLAFAWLICNASHDFRCRKRGDVNRRMRSRQTESLPRKMPA